MSGAWIGLLLQDCKKLISNEKDPILRILALTIFKDRQSEITAIKKEKLSFTWTDKIGSL